MKTLSVIKHGHCSTCDEDKTISVYRDEDGEVLDPICGACELKVENWVRDKAKKPSSAS